MQGVELVEDRKTKKPAVDLTLRLFEATKEKGLLIGKGGMYGNVLRLTPPMVVEESEIDEALATLDQAFAVATK
jgi:4-aminobutyrate aminotransferase